MAKKKGGAKKPQKKIEPKIVPKIEPPVEAGNGSSGLRRSSLPEHSFRSRPFQY
jgi:hypothetical protein